MKEEILSLWHVCVSENGNEELREVSFSLYQGDILGLISLDNQGLTVLLDLIMNNRRLDRGHMLFKNVEVSSYLMHKGKPNKVALIETKSQLIPALNIADTFFFVKEKGPQLINRRKQNQQIRSIFELYGMDLTGNEYPDELSVLDRCRVEIIKAKILGYKIIIVREPSSFLTSKEVRCIHELIKRIAETDGIAFIYLCNHHQETLSVCTRLVIMNSGMIMLNKSACNVTEDMMTVVSNDFLKSITGLRRQSITVQSKPVAVITGNNGFKLSITKGECLVLLDLNNKAIPQISDALFHPRISSYRIFIEGKEAYRYPRLWSFIPANPVSASLFFNMSYIDNLTLRNSTYKLPHFWTRRRYRNHICTEYRWRVGDCVDSKNLLTLTQRELYELIYRRAELERPRILFIVQPFNRMDMYQRIRTLEYIAELQRKGITIIILAISLSDSLQIASRLILLQNHKIEKELQPENFNLATAYGLIIR